MSFVAICVLLLLLGLLVVALRFMLWPVLQTAAALIGATWVGRAGLNPRTPQGRWRLLGIACCMAAILLALQAKGYQVLDPAIALMNIDISGMGQTVTSIFALMSGFLIFVLLGARCFARAKRFDVRPASEVLSEDTRPPVLYLRSFDDDSKAGRRIGISQFSVNTEEGEIAEVVRSIGPLVAIGRPGEELSYFGAARVYVGEGDWQERVRGLLSHARLVIMRAGKTAGLSWELEQCAKVVRPEKLIILIPLKRRQYEEFRLKSVNLFRCRLPDYNGRRVGETTIRAILFFDSDWTPHLLPIIKETYLAYWIGLFIGSFLSGDSPVDKLNKPQSNMRRVLENALQPVLQRSLQ